MFDKRWIIKNSIPIVKTYNGNLTIRALHYRLVALGMTNDTQHYKKVVNAMFTARWEGLLDFDDFRDHERETIGETRYEETSPIEKSETAKKQIKLWADSFTKNRWENQPIYAEVFIEKKALQGVFEKTCYQNRIALNPCKGYPSLTFQYDASLRFKHASRNGKELVILYFGDYDCSGEDIPRSLGETLEKMGVSVDIRRIALMEDQVVKWELPPAPSKKSDSRSRNWDGLGQVELDAIEPDKIIRLLQNSIDSIFDNDLYNELKEQEEIENKKFKEILKRDFKSLLD